MTITKKEKNQKLKNKNKILYSDIYDFKLTIIYKDSQVKRKFYFDSYFKLFKFMYKQLHKPRVESLEVEVLDV